MSAHPVLARTLLLAVSSLALSGCHATATVSLMKGNSVEARIMGGDRERLWLRSEAGADLYVPRRDVRDIDHPGNVLALIGGLIGGSYAASLAIQASSCNTVGVGPALCVGMGSLAVAGWGLFALGLWQWLSSRNAVEPNLDVPLPPLPQPSAPPCPAGPPPGFEPMSPPTL